MNMNQQNAPSENQRKYLGLLLSRAYGKGVPHLPIDTLSRRQVSEWIDYLKAVVGEEGAKSSPSLRDRPERIIALDAETGLEILAGTDGYRAERVLPARVDHMHSIEPWMTEDGREIIECVLCGDQS